jgi:inosine-uridine nucleoside N-ribohydrolase
LTRGQTIVDWRQRGGGRDNADIVLKVDMDVHRRQLRRALGLA